MLTKISAKHVGIIPNGPVANLRSPLLLAECWEGTKSYQSSVYSTGTTDDSARENLGGFVSVTDPERRGNMVLSYECSVHQNSGHEVISTVPFVARTERALIAVGNFIDPFLDACYIPHMGNQNSFRGSIMVDTTTVDPTLFACFNVGMLTTLATATGTFTTWAFASANLYVEQPDFFQPNK